MRFVNPARLGFLIVFAAAQAQLAAPAAEIPLYPVVAPGSENWHYSERTIGTPLRPEAQNIVRPVLLYYPADKSAAVGTAVIVAPGGGFRGLMMSYEGVDVARRLNLMGVDALVLKYRTIYAPVSASEVDPQADQNVRELAKADGRQAVKLVRQRAAEFHVHSAGGAVLLAAVCGPAEGRPDFAMPIYAAGANSEAPPAGAPPLFIAVAADDQAVGYQGSVDLFEAWRKASVPVELHVFQTGRHGFGVKGGGADHYLDRVEEWLKVNGWLTKP
jgi:hypothetical protein